MKVVENGGRSWACEFWEVIETELDKSSDNDVSTDIINMIFNKTRDKAILSEVIDKLNDTLNKDKEYYLSGTFNRRASKPDFEGFLKLNGLLKINKQGLEHLKDIAIDKINRSVDVEISADEWDNNLLIAELYSIIRADFDMERCNFSNTWYEDINVFRVNGYFYEYKENKYVLINKGLDKVNYAKVMLR